MDIQAGSGSGQEIGAVAGEQHGTLRCLSACQQKHVVTAGASRLWGAAVTNLGQE